MPASLVPSPLRPWISDIADRMCVPIEMIAIPALVSIAAVIGRTVTIRPKRHDDWTVVPNLWGGVIARPGLMKTPAISEATKPLNRLAIEARQQFERDVSSADDRRALLSLEATVIESKIKSALKAGKGDVVELQQRLAETKKAIASELVTERRYVTQDATVEKLGELLCANPRGLLLARDELSGWLRTMDKPGREGDRQFYLEAWNGDGAFTYDRIDRGTIHVPALCLSVLGGIQPGRIATYIREATCEGAGADGLLQRVQLLIWPDEVPEWHNVDRYPNSNAKNAAFDIFKALDDLVPGNICASDDGGGIPSLRFHSDAQELFNEWRDELEVRLRSSEFTHRPALESHIAKYRSLHPSLALIFHLIDVVSGATTLKRGVGWGRGIGGRLVRLLAAPRPKGLCGSGSTVRRARVVRAHSRRRRLSRRFRPRHLSSRLARLGKYRKSVGGFEAA